MDDEMMASLNQMQDQDRDRKTLSVAAHRPDRRPLTRDQRPRVHPRLHGLHGLLPRGREQTH